MSDSHHGWAGGGGDGARGGLRALWDGLRTGTAPPRRDRIDPRALGPMLERVVLMDHLAHRLTRIRIAGREIVDLAGRDLRGMPFPILFSPEDRPRLAAALEQVFAHPAILELGLRCEGGFPRSAARYRLQILPLVSTAGRIEQAICGITGTRALPFAAALRIERMLQERLAQDDATPRDPAAESDAALSRAAPPPPLPRAAPRLRLVHPAPAPAPVEAPPSDRGAQAQGWPE